MRATREETGLTLLDPQVCSVVEMVQTSEGHHWVSIFMAGQVAEPGAQPTAPKDAVCTGACWLVLTHLNTALAQVLLGVPSELCGGKTAHLCCAAHPCHEKIGG